VRVRPDDPGAVPPRVGASASVTVYARDQGPLVGLARFWERLDAWGNHIR
jgi:hypothetical protein